MTELPKLRIKWSGKPFWEKTIDLKKARYNLPFDSPATLSITLEGHSIRSYEELVRLATAKPNRDKQLLEVVVIAPLAGG